MQQETQEEGKGCATGPLGEGGRQEHLAGIATGTRGGGATGRSTAREQVGKRKNRAAKGNRNFCAKGGGKEEHWGGGGQLE